MIRISDIALPFDHTDDDLRLSIVKILGIKADDLKKMIIVRRSLDARKKTSIKRVYTIHVQAADELKILENNKNNKKFSLAPSMNYKIPNAIKTSSKHRPIIVGTGPAGLFAGLILAEAGYQPLLLDRGNPVRERAKDTYTFWESGELNPESNVQFGEGGAGTFSDGKLQTRVKDKRNRDKKILSALVEAGAPEAILYDNKPHLGTATMVKIVENLRQKIISLGGEFRYKSRVDDFLINGADVAGVVLYTGEEIHSDRLILAIGHSARDTFLMLHNKGVALEPKPFSIGFRIEHPQDMIDQSQYGKSAGHPLLGAADYQLAYRSISGRTVYSFCMCPGGTVIAAASEAGGLVTNGMSQYARKEINANSAIVAEVYPADFGEDPLAGIKFQTFWEQKAFQIGGNNSRAPVQLLEDYMQGCSSKILGEIKPSYKPGFVLADLQDCLPGYVIDSIREALPEFEKKIKGFARPDAVLTGVETRTSSPVRILRGRDYQSLTIRGLFPTGEGSGYAGGILSSAIDGIKVAEAIIEADNLI